MPRMRAFLRKTLYGPDLTEAQADDMMAAATRRLERRQKEYAGAQELVNAGVASQLSLGTFLEEIDRARKERDLAGIARPPGAGTGRNGAGRRGVCETKLAPGARTTATLLARTLRRRRHLHHSDFTRVEAAFAATSRSRCR